MAHTFNPIIQEAGGSIVSSRSVEQVLGAVARKKEERKEGRKVENALR